MRMCASSRRANRSLAQLSAQGAFRQDLYYRLNVLTVTLPPLRDRRDDIGLLAQHFAIAAGRKFLRPVPPIAPEALRKLLRHDWPGNVRELEHVVERAVLMATGGLVRETDLDIADPPGTAEPALSFRAAKAQVVEAFERSFIQDLLTASVGNVSHAARQAGKDRRAFFELMRKHAIEPQRFRAHP
jgi:two-component system response regulator GlrR